MKSNQINIVFIANIEWNFLKQRHQFLAEILENMGQNVIFIESSAKRNPKLSDIPRIVKRLIKVLNKKKSSYSNSNNTVKVITPIVLPSTNKFFNLINDKILTKKLVNQVANLKTHKKTAIINYLPSHTSLKICEKLKHDFMIYDCVSNFEYVPNMPKDVVYTEDRLIKLSDIVVYDCNFLKSKHELKAKHNIVIPPGVNFNIFNLNLKREKIEKVLYFGLVSEKIDLNLLSEVSNICKLDIIGESRIDLDGILVNEFIDKVENFELPNLIKNYDALLLPYKTTEYAKGVIPAKFFECLATGLPVIASATPNFLDYKEFLILSETGEYKELIKNYVYNESERSSRIALAAANDWNFKGKKFWELIVNGI